MNDQFEDRAREIAIAHLNYPELAQGDHDNLIAAYATALLSAYEEGRKDGYASGHADGSFNVRSETPMRDLTPDHLRCSYSASCPSGHQRDDDKLEIRGALVKVHCDPDKPEEATILLDPAYLETYVAGLGCQANAAAKGEGPSSPSAPPQTGLSADAYKDVIFAVWCKSIRESMIQDEPTREVFDADWVDYENRDDRRKKYCRIGGCIETAQIVLNAAYAPRQAEEAQSADTASPRARQQPDTEIHPAPSPTGQDHGND